MTELSTRDEIVSGPIPGYQDINPLDLFYHPSKGVGVVVGTATNGDPDVFWFRNGETTVGLFLQPGPIEPDVISSKSIIKSKDRARYMGNLATLLFNANNDQVFQTIVNTMFLDMIDNMGHLGRKKEALKKRFLQLRDVQMYPYKRVEQDGVIDV